MNGFSNPDTPNITSNLPDDNNKFNEVSLEDQKVIAEAFAFLDMNLNENLMNCVETYCALEADDFYAGDHRIIPAKKTTIDNDGFGSL